ncbi:hypothetical protein [Streptomyces sp. NPDC005374]
MSLALKTQPDNGVAHALGDVYRRLADTCEALTVRVEGRPARVCRPPS